MADIYAWFDARLDLSVANAAALPSTGNWTGRQAITTDYGLLYWWNGTGWKQVSPSSVRFKGSVLNGAAVAVNTNVNYSTIVEDTASGWNATNKNYVIPIPGAYLIIAAMKADTSGPGGDSMALFKNGSKVVQSPNGPSGNFTGLLLTHYEVCAAGDTLAVQFGGVPFTMQDDHPAHNNYFEVVRIA